MPCKLAAGKSPLDLPNVVTIGVSVDVQNRALQWLARDEQARGSYAAAEAWRDPDGKVRRLVEETDDVIEDDEEAEGPEYVMVYGFSDASAGFYFKLMFDEGT